jgi:hypothetical protein
MMKIEQTPAAVGSDAQLGPLPERFDVVTRSNGPVPVWTAEDMRAYAAACVAAERKRLEQDVAGLHMAQSINHQNHPSAWHDGVDAALEVIRGA